MKSKVRQFSNIKDDVQIKISPKVKTLHPVIGDIIKNLAQIGSIRYIRILPDFLQASSEITDGRIKIPITKPGHATAIGVWLTIDDVYEEVQFYEINSAVAGYGGKMVDAVMRALPQEWKAFIFMDWSGGFWEKMQHKYENLEIL